MRIIQTPSFKAAGQKPTASDKLQWQLNRRIQSRELPPQTQESNKQKSTIDAIRSRIDPSAYREWIADREMESEAGEDYAVEEYLQDAHQIHIRDDGLIEFWRLEPETRHLIGDLPVVLHHHTSSKLLPKISKEGLRSDVKKRSNPYQNSGAGVYLTTEQSGNAVNGYHYNAVQRHGGDPHSLEVRTTLDQLNEDPDDADLLSGNYQFVATQIPREDIINLPRKNKR